MYNWAFGLNLWEKTKALSESEDSNYGPHSLAASFKGCIFKNTKSFQELFEINQTNEPNKLIPNDFEISWMSFTDAWAAYFAILVIQHFNISNWKWWHTKSYKSLNLHFFSSFSLLSTLKLYSLWYRGPFSFLSKTPFSIGLIYLKIPSLLLNSDFSFSNFGGIFFLLLKNCLWIFLFSTNSRKKWSSSCDANLETTMFGIPNMRVWSSIHLEPEFPDFTGASAPWIPMSCYGSAGPPPPPQTNYYYLNVSTSMIFSKNASKSEWSHENAL